MEQILDRLIQEISSAQLSQISKTRGCVGHHIVRRHNKLFRWDLENIMFVTLQEHQLIHTISGYEDDNLSLQQKIFKELNNNLNIKDYLIKNCTTEEEFLQNKYEELIKLLPNKYEQYLLNREINGIATFHTKMKEQKELDKLNTIKLRNLKTKTRRHKKILELKSSLRKKAYKRLKEWKNNKKLDLNNSLDKLQLVKLCLAKKRNNYENTRKLL